MDAIVPRVALGKNRGNALTSAERGIPLASRRRGRGLHVADYGKAVELSNLAKGIQHVGRGMIVLDAGIRLRGVRKKYLRGENWMREASVQATGFGLGGAAGTLAGTVTVSALSTIALAATPVGWVIVIGAGLVVGFGVATVVDQAGQSLARGLWDLSSGADW
ncbi:uncharacterized protein sS8_3509 [Methylocaldum marinum]|uniref:Uncharacterized protein n=1 Tax=Methylocaldum marinum TaxID=1432792 RepID=A0A250KV88_9GAMM|nr:hypothetical protein [Methylocaldum marinum]BBA35446.1 uncharacterized protein sS8_3509 [Methylocaldum marinum]